MRPIGGGCASIHLHPFYNAYITQAASTAMAVNNQVTELGGGYNCSLETPGQLQVQVICAN